MKRRGMALLVCAALTAGMFTGCANATSASALSADVASSSSAVATAVANGSGGSALDTASLFTDRDLAQTADTSSATKLTVADGENVSITDEGVYVVSGTAKDCTITVEADDAAKVQIVLDGVSIANTDAPAIYVVSADKVFVTTASGSTNELAVTGTFATTAEDNIDGVIYAKDDIVLNGEGTLVINSSANGIVGKDDVKVTGGTYQITAAGHGIQGKDSVVIADGTFIIKASTDAIHSKNDEDDALGYIYIANGSFDLSAASDAIGGTSVVQVDGGTFKIDAAEALEGTYVQINDGTFDIQASDDAINTTTKSTAYSVLMEINGGNLTINMASGDTDALDSNGDIVINGGTLDITAQSAFDFDGRGSLNGGTVTVNGTQVTELTNSMMGGGMGGSRGSMGAPSGSSGSMGAPSDSSGSMGGPRGGMGGSKGSMGA